MTDLPRKHRHPQVLLLGNGVNRAFGGGSWGDLIRQITVNEELPEHCELHLPMPLRAILVTGDTVGAQLRDAGNILYGKLGDPGHAEMLHTLLDMGFDHILTTNFSYELEMAAQPELAVDDILLEKMTVRSGGETALSQYLLRTHYEFDWNQTRQRVWHIHGEGRNPQSMILGHYYYGNLLRAISEELDVARERHFLQQQSGEAEVRSWADAFLLGDVYSLGFGFDVSEVDLWWLLNRKKRERAETGDTWYFAPRERMSGKTINEKEELLRVLGVEVCHCGSRRPVGGPLERSGGFREFYQLAIEEIRALMALHRT